MHASPHRRPLRLLHDPWIPVLATLHLAHSLWFARLYPDAVADPDLLAYFVYFKNWLAGVTSLHDVAYFTVPKPLLIALLGPLGDARLAFTVTAACSAALGVLVYLTAREAFGRATGVAASLLLLLDVERATLTLRSSADLYVALLLFAAIRATQCRRYLASGAAIALATLVKPVALPCLAHLLVVEGKDRRRAWAAAALPLLALPVLLAVNQALLGSPFGSERFFAGFDAVSEGELMPASELVRFVVWIQLAKTAFVASAPFGLLGIVVWLARDRQRLTSPFLLVPLCFLAGYLAMSVVRPFVPFFRFFWFVQAWFSCFIVFGMLETARRLAPADRRLRAGLAALLLFFLADDQLARQLHYRTHFAEPFQQAMAFVESAQPTLARERSAGETVLTPLAFLPYLLWTLDDARREPALVETAEQFAGGAGDADPDWILWVPDIFLSRRARDRVQALVASGAYEARITAGNAALLARRRVGPLALGRQDGGPMPEAR